MKPIKIEYDPEIMDALLAESQVAEEVAKMTPDQVETFKYLLVNAGTYKRYVWEQQKKQIKEMIGDAFPGLRKKAREVDQALRGGSDDRVVRVEKKSGRK